MSQQPTEYAMRGWVLKRELADGSVHYETPAGHVHPEFAMARIFYDNAEVIARSRSSCMASDCAADWWIPQMVTLTVREGR